MLEFVHAQKSSDSFMFRLILDIDKFFREELVLVLECLVETDLLADLADIDIELTDDLFFKRLEYPVLV